jgi:hypothetical protein
MKLRSSTSVGYNDALKAKAELNLIMSNWEKRQGYQAGAAPTVYAIMLCRKVNRGTFYEVLNVITK